MKWRDDHIYNTSYVVHRIVTELKVDEELAWDTLEEEFGLDHNSTIHSSEAAYLAEVIGAGLPCQLMAEVRVEQEEELLTSKEVASILKMSLNKLNGERAAGNISYLRFGGRIYFTRDAISEYRRKNTHQVVPQRCLRETYRKRRAV